jgi:SAM-dependent methyltransferase
MADGRDDLALASSDWMRALPAWQRTALLEQRGLRATGLRKQSRAAEMLFTPLGMQQMTTEALALYKATRIPEGVKTVADLCCGPGGDSLHLPAELAVVGVDRDMETLRAYLHNMRLFRPAHSVSGVCADVTRFEARVDGIFLDPARRTLAETRSRATEERDFDAEPEPGWNALAALIRKFGNAVLKLGPGARLPEELEEGEREYLGLRDECLELTVRTGAFGRPGWVRAVELPSGAFVEAPAVDLNDTFGNVEEPGAWFYEPVKSVVRAHLFGVVAERHGLWQLDGRTAYLSGASRVESPLLKRYRVLKILPVDERALRAELTADEIGTLEIKKRGMDIVPEEWRKRLKPRGPGAATLVFTRLQGKPAVLRVERDRDGVMSDE